MIDPVQLAREAGLSLSDPQIDFLTAAYIGAPRPFGGSVRTGRRMVMALLCAAQIADGDPATISGQPDEVERLRQRALRILDRRDEALASP